MSTYTPTSRTKVRRLSKRAVYDEAKVHEILDEGFLCHVGFSQDGQPFVIPTLYARSGKTIYMHGSGASRMLKTLARGVDVCVTITLVDGYVLARSAFHHSMNYRSVVAFGRAALLADAAEKAAALARFVDALIPGRAAESRPPDRNELAATHVLRFVVEDASAKIRSGGVKDNPADLALPHWAGVVPMRVAYDAPVPDAGIASGALLPDSLKALVRAQGEAR